MNRGRPFINRLVRQRQLQLSDIYHDQNLKQIKPATARLMSHNEAITINNSKGEKIKEVREIQIQRENKLLLSKISSLITSNGSYSIEKTKTIRPKACKSLNQMARKRQFQNIQLENQQLFSRLNNKRATLDSHKFKKDWEDSRNLVKRIQNCSSNLIYLKYREAGSRSKKQQKINAQKLEKINISVFRKINGVKMLIKISYSDGCLNIAADLGNNQFLKVIKIPKDDAIYLIESKCQGKIQRLLQKLSYNRSSSSFNLTIDDQYDSCYNPQVTKRTTLRNSSNKLKALTQRVIKSDLQPTVQSTDKSGKIQISKHQQKTLPNVSSFHLEHKKSEKKVSEENDQQKYEDEQFQEQHKEQKIVSKEEMDAIIHNQKQKVSQNSDQDHLEKEQLIKVEEQMYNQDFQ